MADIAFLLLVFFMVTTIFRLEDGLPIQLPDATELQTIPREKVAHIWVDRTGVISINDKIVNIDAVEPIVARKLREDPALVIAFNTDKDTPYRYMDEIMEKLKLANASRVSFTADRRRGG
jgi:biopolymer transport protein ExbD